MGDSVGVDGFALWSNMLTQCGSESETEANAQSNAADDDLQREQIISARVCGDGEDAYFYQTYIRQSDFKLIVNNSAPCPGNPTVSGDVVSYYPFIDGRADRVP